MIGKLLRHATSTRTPQIPYYRVVAFRRSLATPLPDSAARRHFAAKSSADAAVEELQDLYATARDEVRLHYLSQSFCPIAILPILPIFNFQDLCSRPVG